MKQRDLVGQVFGHLRVVAKSEPHQFPGGRKTQVWVCQCDLCGKQKEYLAPLVHQGVYKRCDCEKPYMDDLTNKKFGEIIVIKMVEQPDTKKVNWLCHCEACGNDRIISAADLLQGKYKSCGCQQYVNGNRGHTLDDLTGQRFGRLVIIRREENHINPNGAETVVWRCRCDCGVEKNVSAYNLKRGKTLSCGCLRRENRQLNIVGKIFGNLQAMERADSLYQGNRVRTRWRCRCLLCGRERVVLTDKLTDGSISACEECTTKSSGEKKIKNLLMNMQLDFSYNTNIEGCYNEETGGLPRFDFALIENNLLIEYDGDQHFGLAHGELWDYNDVLRRDMFKDLWCSTNNRPLLRIPFTEYDKLSEEYLKDAIELALKNADNGDVITCMNESIYSNRTMIEKNATQYEANKEELGD